MGWGFFTRLWTQLASAVVLQRDPSGDTIGTHLSCLSTSLANSENANPAGETPKLGSQLVWPLRGS